MVLNDYTTIERSFSCLHFAKGWRRGYLFMFSVKTHKWSFHVADWPRTVKKYIEVKKKKDVRGEQSIKGAKSVSSLMPLARGKKLNTRLRVIFQIVQNTTSRQAASGIWKILKYYEPVLLPNTTCR